MPHKYWEERLQAFVDNELGPADRAAFEEHSNACRDCSGQVAYFMCLKQRLKAHRDCVEMPADVKMRLTRMIQKKTTPFYKRRLYLGSGLAAAILIGFLLSLVSFTTPASRVGRLRGKIVCHDCELAVQVGHSKGSFCQDQHRLGLKCPDNKLWRFIADQEGVAFIHQYDMYNQVVEVEGEILERAGAVVIHKLKPTEEKQARLFGPAEILPVIAAL